jgi:hypothetical protein
VANGKVLTPDFLNNALTGQSAKQPVAFPDASPDSRAKRVIAP